MIHDEIATGLLAHRHRARPGPPRGAGRHRLCRQGADRRLPHPGRHAVHRRGGAAGERLPRRRDDARPHLHGRTRSPARSRTPASTCWRRYDNAANIRRIEDGLRRGLAPAADAPGVVDVRTLGAVGVVELDAPGRRAEGHRARPRPRRLAAAVPQPRLHDAAVRHLRRRPRHDHRAPICEVVGVSDFEDWLAEQAQQREEAGLTRRLVPRHPSEPVIDLAGNDYLGLARHPRVVEGAVAAAQEYGAGAGASRLVTGTLTPPRGARAGARHVHRLPDRAGVLDRLPRQPLRGLRADRRRHPGRLRRPRARLDDRRLPAQPRAGAGGPAQRRRRRRRCAGRAAPSRARWCWSRRSTPCSATPRRSPTLAEVCAARGAVLVADEAHALGVAGAGGRGLLHAGRARRTAPTSSGR